MWGAALGLISEGTARDEGETLQRDQQEHSLKLERERAGGPKARSRQPQMPSVGKASSVGEVPKM